MTKYTMSNQQEASGAVRVFDRQAAIRRYMTLTRNPLRKRTWAESFASVILGGTLPRAPTDSAGRGLQGDLDALGLDMRNAIASYEKNLK